MPCACHIKMVILLKLLFIAFKLTNRQLVARAIEFDGTLSLAHPVDRKHLHCLFFYHYNFMFGVSKNSVVKCKYTQKF